MSFLLERPETVLVLGDGERIDRIRSALADVVECVCGASEPAEATETLETRQDVGCLVAEQTLADASTCASIRAITPVLPIVILHSDDAPPAAEYAHLADCRFVARENLQDLPGVVSEAIDTYEQRRADRAEASMFETFLAECEMPAYVKDAQGRHLRMADVEHSPDPESVVGRTDLDIWGDETPEMARSAYEDDLAVVETGEPIYDKDERFDQGEYTYWSRTTKVPWRFDGEICGLVGVSTDITEHVNRATELEHQREIIQQFTSHVSHDLRTPLQVASGNLAIARKEGDEGAFEAVDSALGRMEETIEDLSDLANRRAEASTLPETSTEELADTEERSIVTPTLVPIIHDVWSIVGTDDATLTVDLPQETTITTNEETVRPLIENLLKNAVDHGGDAVDIRVGPTDDNGFFVADDGPGIPPEEREAVLEEGYTTAASGSGTGLHIVSQAAAENGWTVVVTESVDGGARIEVNDCHLVADPPAPLVGRQSISIDQRADIGPVKVDGSAEYVASVDRWIVAGAGANVWDDTNEFHFAYGTTTGPARIEGRLRDLDGVDEYSKAGLMIRDSLDPDGLLAFVGRSSGHGTELLWREATDEPTTSDQFEEPPEAYEWYRLEQQGATVTCSISADGSQWIPIDQRELPLAERYDLGMVVCSHDPRVRAVAEFEGLEAVRTTSE